MKLEIERKFLVRGPAWRSQAQGALRLRQGYLANTPACSIRVREAGNGGTLSLKGMRRGRVRPEYEYAIPVEDARELLAAFACGPLVDKLRHRVEAGGSSFEVDEFLGDNAGLVVAEIELPDAEAAFDRPDWLGDEVTDDERFYNFRLAERPFAQWDEAERRAAQSGRRPGREAR